MKFTFDVPESAQRAARRALALQKESPLPDVGGQSVAEVLATGVATLDVVGKIHRFFRVNERVYAAETQGLHTEHDSPTIRSWLLYGAESAQRWADGIYRKAVAEGYRPSDAVTDLFGALPDEVYAAFSVGAWRFEYDLDPRKAARFVEEYHRATGWNLDLHRAFGESGKAVATALYRRFHPIDPFKEAARCLTVEDAEYRLAAQVDLAELTHSVDALEEGLKPGVFIAAAPVTAKAVWPAFVAYVILASERPELLVAMNKASQKPPLLNQKPKSFATYHDAINTFVAFFHPNGSRFIDPKKANEENAKAFGTLPEEMEDLIVRAYYGRHVSPVAAQKLLGKARRWTAENKFAGSLFHVFNADWKKGNWQHILDNIPEDADVRPYFQEFVKENPMPAAGVKLQQTLSDKSLKQEVAVFLFNQGQVEDDTVDALYGVKIDDTQAGEACQKLGTPLGVYSVVGFGSIAYDVLGAFKTKGGVHYVLRVSGSASNLSLRADAQFALSFTKGEAKVIQAHKDMPGSSYGGKKPVPPKTADAEDDANVSAKADPKVQTPSLVSPGALDPEVAAYLLKHGYATDEEVAESEFVDIATTKFAKAAKTKYGKTPRAKALWTHTSVTGTVGKYEIVGTYKWSEASWGTRLVMRSLDSATYYVGFDMDAAEEVTNGKLVPTSTLTPQKAADDEALPDDEALSKDVSVIAQAATALGSEFGTLPIDWKVIALTHSTWWAVAQNLFGVTLDSDQNWTRSADWLDKTQTLRLVAALNHETYGTHFAFENLTNGAKNGVLTRPDQDCAQESKAGILRPFGWAANKPPIVQQAPAADVLQPESNPFGFHQHDVVSWDGTHWLILAEPTGSGSSAFYPALELAFQDGEPSAMPTQIGRAQLEKEGQFVGTTGGLVTPFVKFFKYPPDTVLTTTNSGALGVSPGNQFVDNGKAWTVIGYFLRNQKLHVFAAAPTEEVLSTATVDSWAFLFKSVEAVAVAVPDYNPPAAPESAHEDDEPDPEQGSPEMSGTQAAFDFLAKKGWTPATKSESPLFIFPLGGRQFYGSDKRRTIIGYGFTAFGSVASKQPSPVYVHVTEVGNIGYVECANGHGKYGPLDQMVQSIVDALLPKPGEKKQVFPKLNYKLSKKAKEIAQAKGTIFVPAPTGAAFKVNTPLLYKNGGKFVLVGWVQQQGEKWPWAALYNEDTEELDVELTAKDLLATHYTLRFDNDSSYTDGTGEIVFGKKPGQDVYKLTIGMPSSPNKVLIPSDPPEGWDSNPLIHQPPVPAVDSGKHFSAGIVAIVPAGVSLNGGPGGVLVKTPYASVVLYHPLGQYGGYKLNIPKGTVDKGESLLKAAIREFHEETGLTARAVAYLGDFRGNQSLTRLYVGYVTGGNPYKKKQPEECDAVTFKPLVNLDLDGGEHGYQSAKWYKQLVPASGNKWQQDAIDAAVDWLVKNGMPETYQPTTETQDTAVSKPTAQPDPFAGVVAGFEKLGAAAAQAGASLASAEKALTSMVSVPVPENWAPTVPPSEMDEDDPWKALLFKVQFPITSTMVDALKARAKLGAVTPVAFDCARKRVFGPAYGQAFETSGGTPYLAAGYVSWKGDDGQLHDYLLALSGAGSVSVILCGPDGLKDAKVSSDQSLAAGPQDAWYQHPDPTINAVIQSVYQTGTLDGTGCNMKTFKESWMKAAGVPAYAVITANMLRDVASLFVPGACPQVVRDAILLCLKSRMKATHSGKKGKSTPMAPPSYGGTAAPPAAPYTPAPAPPKVILPTGPLSPILKQYVTNPQPYLFTATGKKVAGGSKPNMLLDGPGGKQWFAKFAPGEDWRAYVDRAAYQLSELCKPNNVPIGVMEFDGKVVSYQPYASDAKAPPADPTTLDEQNMAELLAQHAVDMFMGDHDGHAGNWISVGGRIIAVDRGQAFKFLLQNKAESLDPSWHAPGNFGDGYAKTLLLRWGKGEVEIPDMAWASMLKSIRSVGKLTEAQIGAILLPVFDSAGTPVADRSRVLAALVQRAGSYEKDWTTVLRKLRKGFAWPKTGVTAAPTKVFTSSPKDVGFGKPQEKTIADAVAAKWQGKALQLGGLTFENQEVMVRRVLWEEKPGLKVPATLIHFRVARPAGVAAAKKLYGSSNLEVTETLGGPQRLKIDQKGNYWEKIYAAAKTLNHHLFVKKDTAVNEQTIKTMSDLRPTLDGLLKIAADSSGVYAPTNEPNEAVYAMAEQYLQYLGIIEYWVAKKEELIGQHSPTLVEFLWEPPVPDHAVSAEAPPYKVSLKKQGALWPTAVPVGQEVHVTNLNKPVMNSASQSQFVIEDPLTKARVFWNPPGGLSASGLENVKDGVESLKGQGWAIVPGEPSSATVAHLLKLFSDATGLGVQAADAQDAEVLYWSKQANVLQGGGVVKPKNDHTSVVEKGYEAALSLYEKGQKAQAISALKKFVADKLGTTVGEVDKLAPADEVAGRYTRGAGFFRHHRIGWTRERLQQVMGKDCRLAHHLADTPAAWMQAMTNNGALISNAIKAFYGVTKTGASPGQDMNVGGGQGLFLCFRKGFSSQAGMIYFDISLALRLDVYIVGKGDTYGGTNVERYTTPEQWTAMGAHTHTGATGASSGQQVNIRHDIDLREYLVAVMCGNASVRAECIKLAKSLGWTFYGGASPEDVFRA